MRVFEYQRTTTIPLIVQAVFVVLCGLALSWLAVNVPVPALLAALVAVGYCIVFLQRPDLGLLAILAVRPTTDLSMQVMTTAVRVSSVAAFTPNAAPILVLIGCGALYIVGRRVPFLSLPGGVLLVLMQLAGLVGILRSESILSSLNQWLAIVSTVIVYALAARLFRTPPQIQRVIDVLAVSFVTPAIFGLWQLTHVAYSGFRVKGTFVTAPGFSQFLVLILVVFAGQLFVHSGIRKFLAMVIVATSGILLVATYTRGAWAAALAALFVIAILGKRVLLMLALIAIVLTARMIPSIDARLAEASTQQSSLANRQVLWQSTIREWEKTTDTEDSIPTIVNRLLGLGPKSQALLTGRTEYGEPNVAHNDYLRVAIDYGLFGLIVYLLLMLVVTVFAYRTWRRCTDKRLGAVMMSFVALTVAYSIFSLTDNIFGTTYVQIPLWTLAGLNIAIARLQTKGEVHQRPA